MNLKLETKGWGTVRHAFDSPQCAVSILHTEAGGYCSRHYHEERVNRFVVVMGAIDVVLYSHPDLPETGRHRLNPGDVFDVDAQQLHRFEVVEPGIVVEVYWPSATVRQDDIVRLDIGGRRA